MNSLKHYGVLGMKWGRRKAQDRSSSDHSTVAAIRKKRLRNMTNDEIKTAAKRMKLVSEYKKSGFRSKKKISEMSNDELIKATRRGTLMKLDWKKGVRKDKPIKKMTDEEVKATLDRYLLEKQYKELRMEELEPVRRLVYAFISFSSSGKG